MKKENWWRVFIFLIHGNGYFKKDWKGKVLYVKKGYKKTKNDEGCLFIFREKGYFKKGLEGFISSKKEYKDTQKRETGERYIYFEYVESDTFKRDRENVIIYKGKRVNAFIWKDTDCIPTK